MRFTKMHGTGNDYVFVDTTREEVSAPSELAVDISRRHYGVGSDGLILIGDSERADVSMRIFNADGSEAEMCGNGIRCVGKYAYDHRLCRQSELSVETPAGVRTIELHIDGDRAVAATVNMGQPGLRRGEIPMEGPPSESVVEEVLELSDREVSITCISMGNPHCILTVPDIDALPWRKLGRELENHPVFPERTNVHFVEVQSEEEVRMVTWERGSGATLACGTGASAVCAACNLENRTSPNILAHLPGGDLELQWGQEDRCIYMTGPAVEVFRGDW
ncbi:MAG: diaminopimelate epimerase [Candidatus Brocadiia bacterium]